MSLMTLLMIYIILFGEVRQFNVARKKMIQTINYAFMRQQ